MLQPAPQVDDLGAIHDMHAVDLKDIDLAQMRVIKRDGTIAEYRREKIESAMLGAFLEVLGSDVGNSLSTRNLIRQLCDEVIRILWQRKISGGNMAVHIEEIQDVVEETLMRSQPKVARAYVLYREKRAALRAETEGAVKRAKINVVDDTGALKPLPLKQVTDAAMAAAQGLDDVDPMRIVNTALGDLYDGVSMKGVRKAMVLSSRLFVEEEPNYSFATARLLLTDIRLEVLGRSVTQKEMARLYPSYFADFIKTAIDAELLNPELGKFNLKTLGKALNASRDNQFQYMGLQTLYDRYFLHINDRRIELPQAFYMRVAMGLAIREADGEREKRAIEFYEKLSSFDFMSSTPTLFNAGSLRSQLSSCYLTTISDDLEGIYEGIKENALLSKFAGGLGNDWTGVRALGSYIKGTNGKSQGVVPFLKVVNDTAVAVNQGGKRKGAVCAYLETWHLDIEEFLDLRKNTGDDRRRTHDMNTANWIPDLFMKRVITKGDWTLVSPSSAPHLHELTGRAFEQAYLEVEEACDRGDIKHFKRMPAIDLWRKMLTMLFETGHPWITFKDPCNLRSPQQHVGVVHSSNLCTEITLNTGPDEIAVCNLGSVNLVNHLVKNANGTYEINHEKLRKTIEVAMRMLDNVIDINFYPVEKARTSNLRHRPVGMGVMAFQDCLYKMRLPYSSKEAVEFADRSMEAVCYYAYEASSKLAVERGTYESYKGSLWDQGILPLDSLALLEKERGGHLEVDRSSTLDWEALRTHIRQHGMRNSNCVAIAPTATISDIIGVNASIEPMFGNLSVRSTLSGEFTQINEYLVADLKALGLWDKVMVADLKHYDGSLSRLPRVPQHIKDLYQTAFEVDPSWLIESASRRQKWIDQAQSLNLYLASPSGKKLDETYKLAWVRGLKTTYYLRTLGATAAEKSTGRGGELNAVSAAAPNLAAPMPEPEGKVCMMRPGDPGYAECESCQ